MRVLILPCETRAREFDAKLLLACLCANRGVPAIVGAKKTIDLHLDSYPPGVYVGKSATRRSMHNLLIARARGHRVVLWDEEGLVWASREVYWQTKVDAQTLATAELLLAWGEENAETWRAHPDYQGTPIAAAGNPRTDLLRPELADYFAEDQQAIEKSYGPFILINTNFSRVNHVQRQQNRHLRWLREHRPHDPRGGFAAHKYSLFHDFKAMVPTLSRALPDLQFVIRPHPSERIATWHEIARGLPNVRVQAGGNVIPWLRASRGVIHNGCTTAIEAFVAGRPALAYMPSRSAQYDHPLPNGVSLQVDDLPQLLRASRVLWQAPEQILAQQQAAGCGTLLAHNMAGISDQRASDRILEALSELLHETPIQAEAEQKPRLTAPLLKLRRLGRRIEQRIPGNANAVSYLRHMFPSTALRDVQKHVDRLRQCLPEIKPLSINSLQDDVFHIAPANTI